MGVAGVVQSVIDWEPRPAERGGAGAERSVRGRPDRWPLVREPRVRLKIAPIKRTLLIFLLHY